MPISPIPQLQAAKSGREVLMERDAQLHANYLSEATVFSQQNPRPQFSDEEK